ncbi:MAG: heavy metal translocating P-type ATPase, partial [Candidatus Omnitrophica bacterium]|nr:heavy metal translocating P-type ATPase [Candidatus Omnitrophota bacterium]
NKSGSFKFRAAKVGSETVLAQIIKLVEEAQGLKAPIQRLADTIAAYFVPAVLGIGIVTFIIWIVLGGGFSFALTAFISVLIIACPCALGLATPTGVMVASGIGARKGILFKGGESLELAGKINTVIFDKTGTLTRGKPCVTEVISVSNFEKNEVLRFAAIAERNSEHPLAEAIVDAARKDNLDVPQPQGFNSLTGMGVIARFGEDIILLGNRKLFNEKNIDPLPIEDKISELEKQSKTVMIAGYKNEIIGIIAVADVLKDFSKEAVEELKERGKEVVMITGDNRQTALAIGGQLGIEKILPEVMPQEKSNEIKKLQQKGLKVAMVGDGINDAPALAQADVGIALGAGTDIAMESAQIVLIKDDLRDVVTAMDLSRTCLRKIKQNLFWAFFYNIIAIPIAAGALYPFTGFLLSPVVAGAAMAFSSVSVVLNSLSMRK